MSATLQHNSNVYSLEGAQVYTKNDEFDNELVAKFIVEELDEGLFDAVKNPDGEDFIVTVAGVEFHISPYKSVIQASQMTMEDPHTLETQEGSELEIALITTKDSFDRHLA